MQIQTIQLDPIRKNQKSRQICVIRDDLIQGGSKMRGLIPYLNEIIIENPEVEEFIYASPAFGYAQVAIALAAAQFDKQATIFVAERKEMHPNTLLAQQAGAKIVPIPYGYLHVVKKRAQEYVQQSPHTRMLLPWGLSDPLFKDCLTDALSDSLLGKSLGKTSLRNNNSLLGKSLKSIHNIWITVGSGTLFECLAAALPNNVMFNLVQVGAEYQVPKELEHRVNNLFISPEKFEQAAKNKPPYPSNAWYDAKLWQFVEQYAEDGDCVWNVAA
jgi:hypothetical protein